jgi:hypothetical protein
MGLRRAETGLAEDREDHGDEGPHVHVVRYISPRKTEQAKISLARRITAGEAFCRASTAGFLPTLRENAGGWFP